MLRLLLFAFCPLLAFAWPCSLALGETPLATQVVLATYRLEHPATSGTGFIVRQQLPGETKPARSRLLLVTAAHAFEKMAGPTTTLVLRKQDDQGHWHPAPQPVAIRKDEQPLWQQHPQQDVAVLRLELPEEVAVQSLPLTMIAGAEDWQAMQLEPGDLVRCVGYPHAAQFKPSPAGFPLTRLGCLASFPLRATEEPTFLVDYNTFEGDSGGPVYWRSADRRQAKILGLVHGQHLLDERYQLVYQEGLIRKRLGVAIIVNSLAIRETIAAMPAE